MAKSVLQPYKPKKHYVPKVTKHEEGLQRRVCSYLRNHYPHVYFRSDTASGMLLSKYQRMIHHSQQSGPSQPDLMIFYPSRGYHGLLLELKDEGTTIYKKIGPGKGRLVSDPHIRSQAMVLDGLNKLGYCARFAVGEKKAQDLIDWYMERPENIGLEF